MVKIEELSKKEIEERNRFSKLVEIAMKTLPSHNLDSTSIGIGLSPHPDRLADRIHVTPHNNRIVVYSAGAYDSAIKLANAHESSGEPEFTVKKDYVDAS